MKETTLCYIERGSQYLMLHRTRKINDVNHDKWLGIGGHIEPGETPMECILREAQEETGLRLLDCTPRGLVHFRSDTDPDEDMHLFTATQFDGELRPCDEGDLAWIEQSALLTLTLWEGDRIFLRLLQQGAPHFELTLRYHGDRLTAAVLDGQNLSIDGGE